MSNIGQHLGAARVPQSEPLDAAQVKNNAGGYVYEVDRWERLRRFLVLGSEGGSYYATERKLTTDAVAALRECLDEDAERAVREVVAVSDGGRAPKNDPAILALAVASAGEREHRRLALEALPKVCRIPTHLFQFVAWRREMTRSSPRSLRRAVSSWYASQVPEDLAHAVAKYQTRGGWSHKNVFELTHPRLGDAHSATRAFALRGHAEPGTIFEAMARAHEAKGSPAEVVRIIREHGLTHEMVPTEVKKDPRVWEAMLERMPPHAMLRTLAPMTACGLIGPLSKAEGHVADRISDHARLMKSRVHPMAVLIASRAYGRGESVAAHLRRPGQGLSWKPSQRILDALDGAFYGTFASVQDTGKAFVLALDCSGSMGSPCLGTDVMCCRDAAAAVALVIASTQKAHAILGFTAGPGSKSNHVAGRDQPITPLEISPGMRLDAVERYLDAMPFGGTDCALPFLWAREHKVRADCFVVLTDNETWAGSVHPSVALRDYRRSVEPRAGAVGMAFAANDYSILGAEDARAMNVCGLDASGPQLVTDFASRL